MRNENLTPASKRQFIRKILTDPRGEIVVCNILDGMHAALYSENEVKTYFYWWMKYCEYRKFDDCSRIILAMDKLTPSHLPKDFLNRMPSPPPAFLFSCRTRGPSLSQFSSVSAVLPALIIRGKSDIDSRQRLAAKGGCSMMLSVDSDWLDIDVNAFMELPDSEKHFKLRDSESIGNEILWITPTNELNQAISLCIDKADKARDVLGLSHRQPNGVLVALHFPSLGANAERSSRPIFKDARTHNRFMAVARSSKGRRIKAWGRTLDLSSLVNNRLADGLLERVCPPISKSALTSEKIGFTPLGRLKYPRGGSEKDDDEAYSNLLRGIRTTKELENTMVNII